MINSVNYLTTRIENNTFTNLCKSCDQKTDQISPDFANFLSEAMSGSAVSDVNLSAFQNPYFSNISYSNELKETGSMKSSDNLVEFIKNHEGFASNSYRGLDYWNQTIGYGHVIRDGENLSGLTPQSADNLLRNDLKSYESSVRKEFSDTKLTQSQFDALTSFSYALGANIWSKVPNLVNDIKSGAPAETIKADFERCSHVDSKVVQGVVRRRDDEFNMFQNGVYNRI